ncbi:undecaprenyl-phosphate glucose phosphotransferase [Ichthyenterobacterium sp. W332]|uniref:Undecaprenyl-phosphate glucose phosphotransferase n=1 Tax=Microcosmobacter mediterraneus TaxID=3075607 RepID=A0ABU2YIS1_9FLAO|nr:undecaprenyl-phosphate glucose phosphotransferase [Ichthyenterobacterium sp. W332]MDT0558067.1 undecaprenyl-phosphate glucose phosphotransferase [Ichthyenterobacterium sp. W332]
MLGKRGYSQFIRPFLYLVDLIILAFTIFYLLTDRQLYLTVFITFWIILSIIFSFYEVYRYTKIVRIISLLARQIFVFTLLIFSFLYITYSEIEFLKVVKFSIFLFILFSIWRISLHIFLKKYRVVTGRNYKEVVIIGSNKTTRRLIQFFKNEPGYGYNYLGFFTIKNEANRLGTFEDFFRYIKSTRVDEVYCSIKELSNEQMNKLVLFADNNLLTLKFIPDNKYIFSKKLEFENYNIMPILSLSDIPLKTDLNKFGKRAFDIIFSLLVIILILSWFTPLLALIIRIESKGSIFFKQLRYGADFNLFACYKFRSMMANKESDSIQAAKNDMRVTKVGKFIRRTSIDELPQFFNVLFGSMSVVGPRPLLLSHTNDYKDKINKFMIRHMVKPGITGLAQVSGYRGNIETDQDMQNRIKYDIFYVENWSLFLDLKIITKTVINVIKGEEKAY